jgi:cell shape-determining protein MreC
MKKTVVAIIVVLLCVLFFSLSITHTRGFLRDFFLAFAIAPSPKFDLSTVPRVDDLQDIVSRIRNLERENMELRQINRIADPQAYKLMVAEIVIRDPRTWNERFVVNKGRSDGVAEGMIVLALNLESRRYNNMFSIAGRVCSVTSGSSEVETIFDHDFALSVVFGEEGNPAVLTGGNVPRLEYFDASALVKGEMKVLSSSFSLQCPPYIPVGSALVERSKELFYTPSSLPFAPWADFSNARFVIITVPQK